jgi:uroporphyrinogen-III synthase
MEVGLFSDTLIVRTANRLAETIADFPGATGLALAETHAQRVDLPAEIAAVILTSGAAVEAATAHGRPVIAVGEYTAAAAKKGGLNVLLTGKGGVRELAGEIAASGFSGVRLAHLHGDTARTGWHQQLIEAGVAVSAHLAYTTTWQDDIPPELKESLQVGRLRTVCLFSSLMAEHLLSLLTRANIDPTTLTAVVISQQVADAAVSFGCVKVAQQPDRVGIRRLLQERGET